MVENLNVDISDNFRIDGETVISECFDNEVIIIHLQSGAYYSLDESAVIVWKLLQAGCGVAQIAEHVALTYVVSLEEVMPPVEQFIQKLAEEMLILPVSDGLLSSLVSNERQEGQPAIASPSGQFYAPRFNKYTDMQDLLLLDPIHDVSEAGWPHVK